MKKFDADYRGTLTRFFYGAGSLLMDVRNDISFPYEWMADSDPVGGIFTKEEVEEDWAREGGGVSVSGPEK